MVASFVAQGAHTLGNFPVDGVRLALLVDIMIGFAKPPLFSLRLLDRGPSAVRLHALAAGRLADSSG